MLRKFKYSLIGLSFILFACAGLDPVDEEGSLMQSFQEFKPKPKLPISVTKTKARLDKEALFQLGIYEENPEALNSYQLYDQTLDEVDSWTDKLWGRCCTEADMRFSEFLGFDLSCETTNVKYPFSLALDNLFATCFAFKEQENISISVSFKGDNDMYGRLTNKTGSDLIGDLDTIQSVFQISIVNGYAKSEKTYVENGRIKEVELWLNGAHKCNCLLIDTVAIQIIQGNFPYFKNDVIEMVPISYYSGTKYDDVCISAFQKKLGYGAHPNLDKLSRHWNY